MAIRYDLQPAGAPSSSVRHDLVAAGTDNYTPEDQSSVGGALARGIARGALPTAAGFGGAEGGAAAGAGLGALVGGGVADPITVPAGALIGGAIGALGFGGVAGYAQGKVLEANPDMADAIGLGQRQQEADQAEHPIASFVGELAPQAAFLRPSGGVFDLLKAGSKGNTARAGVLAGAALQGGLEAGQEYAADGQIDPTRVAISAGAGALLNKKTKLGEMVSSPFHPSAPAGDAGLAGAEASTDATAVRMPTNLLALPNYSQDAHVEDVGQGSTRSPPNPTLALTDQSGQTPLYADAEGNVGQTPGHTPQLALPAPEPEPVEPGVGQGPNRAATPPAAPLLQVADQRPGVASVQHGTADGSLAPTPTKDLSFTPSDILQRLRAANPKANGEPGPASPFATKLALELGSKLGSGDVVAAEALVQKHADTVSDDAYAGPAAHANTVVAAIDEISAFRKQYAAILPDAAPPAETAPMAEAGPPPIVAAPEPEPAPNPLGHIPANDVAADAIARNADIHRAYTQGHRDALLSNVLDNPDNHSPTASFLQVLRTKGHDDTIQPGEADRIARFEQAKEAFEQKPGTLAATPEAVPVPVPETAAAPEPVLNPLEPAADQGSGDFAADRDAALGAEHGDEGTPGGQGDQRVEPGPDERQTQEPQADLPADGQDRPGQEPAADQAAGEVGPTDQQISDRIDGLFRDKQIGVRERNILKTLQDQVDPKTGKPTFTRGEMSSRIDDFMADKAGQPVGKAKFPQAPAKEVASPNGSTIAKPAGEIPTYAGLRTRIGRLHSNGTITTDQHAALRDRIADRKASPAKISGEVDKLDPQTKDRMGDGGRPAAPSDLDHIVSQTRAALDRAGLHAIGLKFEEELRHGNLGTYGEKLIKLSMDQSLASLADSLHHEMVHAFRDLGIFTTHEWKTLAEAARRDPALDAWATKHYPHLAGDERDEEMVAEMFAKSFNKSAAPTFIGRMVQRVQKFLAAVKQAVLKSPLSAEQIIEKLKSGELGNREMVEPPPHVATPAEVDHAIRSDAEKARRPAPIVPEAEAIKKTPSDVMDSMGGKTRRLVLNWMTQHQIADSWKHSPIGPLLDRWADNLNMSVSLKDTYIADAAHVHDGWTDLAKPEQDAIGSLLHDATRAQVDVTGTGTDDLSVQFKALTPEGKKAYKAVLATFSKQAAQAIEIFKQTIADSSLSDAEKKAATDDVEKKFSRIKVYFPLMRFGDFINVAKSADYTKAEAAMHAASGNLDAAARTPGVTPEALQAAQDQHQAAVKAHGAAQDAGYAVTAHEDRAEQLAVKRQLEAKGMTVEAKKAGEYQARTDGGNTAFVNTLDKLFEADKALHPERAEGINGTQRMMHQLYYSMMPEGSALRNSLERKNIAGASLDAQRTYAAAARRNAGFLAAIQNGERQRQILSELSAKIDEVSASTGDATKLKDVLNQVNKHYNVLDKYSKQPIQTFLSNLTYAYMLGGSPSFMAMHLLQTPMVSAPMLGAHFNPGRVSSELGKAFAEVSSHLGDLKEGSEAKFGKNDGEVGLIKYLTDRAVISNTHSDQFLAAGANPSAIGKVGDAVMKAASFLPHYTEKLNRMGTALAAYRMALTNPKIHAQLSDVRYASLLKDSPELAKFTRQQVAAMRYATQLTLDSHVDYSRENAPYMFQQHATVGVPTKLMFQFQKYQQAMLYSLVRNGMDAFNKNLSGDERWAAAKTLSGVVGTHGMLTGAMGLPAYGVAAVALNAYHKMFGDKDKPFDADDAFHTMLVRTFGKDMGDVVARGALYLPGVKSVLPADITDRLGMGDLLMSSTALDGQVDRNSVAQYIGNTLGGPAASLLGNFVTASQMHQQGDNWKAAEMLMPKVMRDISRTARFHLDGVTTSSNNPVVSADQMTAPNLVAQAMGFTPQVVNEAYENKAAVGDAKAELDARRKTLLKQYTDAQINGDGDKAEHVRGMIDRYNEEQRGRGVVSETITGGEMVRSVQTRRLAGIRLNNGVSLSPKQRGLINEYGSEPQ